MKEITESYEYVFKEKKEYLEKVGSWIQIYEELESYMGTEDLKKLTDEMRKIPDRTLETIIQYLKYYKHDIVHKSIKIPQSKRDVTWRAGAISSIDAMIILLNSCINKAEYVDRIEGKLTNTKEQAMKNA